MEKYSTCAKCGNFTAINMIDIIILNELSTRSSIVDSIPKEGKPPSLKAPAKMLWLLVTSTSSSRCSNGAGKKERGLVVIFHPLFAGLTLDVVRTTSKHCCIK